MERHRFSLGSLLTSWQGAIWFGPNTLRRFSHTGLGGYFSVLQVVYWLGQVTSIWEGRRGFHATLVQEPSMYRLPELVEENIPLLGRYNLVAGLIERTSSAPPSPLTPPSYPAFPPRGGNSSSVNEMVPLMIYLALALGVLSVLTLVYHKCHRRYLKTGAKVKEEVDNPFTANLKAEQAEQVAKNEQIEENENQIAVTDNDGQGDCVR